MDLMRGSHPHSTGAYDAGSTASSYRQPRIPLRLNLLLNIKHEPSPEFDILCDMKRAL